MITYEGDIRLVIDDDGDVDINITGGQPEMTEFIDTTVMMYVFGIDSWYNGIVDEKPEKMQSKFPEFIKTANVSDQSIATGRQYLIEALQPLISEKIASDVSVDGDIISVYGIRWTVEITRFDGSESRFSILWEKGFVKIEEQNGAN